MLSWAAGEGGNKSFSIPIADDAIIESEETFTVRISGASGASLIAPTSAVVTITDNDSAGTVQLSASN